MPDQFVVPQFLDVEAKIIGPITGRQFGILMATVLLDFIFYRIFVSSIILIVLVDILITAAGVILSFAKVNGVPIHVFLLNVVKTLRRPALRVWDKNLSDKELKAILKKEKKEPPPPPPPTKPAPDSSRLNELALMLDTGGTYDPLERAPQQKGLDVYGKKEEK